MPVGYVKLKEFKGVNLTDPPTEIADDELAWARNCWSWKRGYIEPRPVQTAITAGLLWSGTTVLDDYLFESGVFDFIDKNNTQRLVFWVPGNVNSSFFLGDAAGFNFGAGGPFISWPNGAGALVQRPLGFPRRPRHLVYNNELYLFPGHTAPGLILGADDLTKGAGNTPLFRELGTAWTGGTGLSAERYKFTFGEVYRGVFALGGLEPPYESLVFFTNAGSTPDQLCSLAKAAGVGFGDSDKLINVVANPIQGGAVAVEPYLFAFKQRSVWLLQGQPPSSTDNGTLIVTPLMKREGLVAPDAVCKTPYGIVFCSGRNVWLAPPGAQPRPIGDKIKGFLEKLPQQPSCAWFLEFHDDVLYLNFPSPSGVITGKGFGGGGATRTYLPCQQMWCDFRKPDEPRWWGPEDVRACHMRSLSAPDGSRQIAGITAWDEGAGNVRIQPFVMNGGLNFDHAATTGQTIRGDIDLGDPGTLNGVGLGETIPVSVMQVARSRDMDFGDDSLEKIIEAFEINSTWDIDLESQVVPAAGVDFTFTVNGIANSGLNVGATTPPSSIGANAGKSVSGFVLDSDILTTGAGKRLAEAFIPVTYFPAGGTRLLARTLQLLLVGMQTQNANPATSADALRTRKFTVKSMTIRLRPIGRRPGGSYGG